MLLGTDSVTDHFTIDCIANGITDTFTDCESKPCSIGCAHSESNHDPFQNTECCSHRDAHSRSNRDSDHIAIEWPDSTSIAITE